MAFATTSATSDAIEILDFIVFCNERNTSFGNRSRMTCSLNTMEPNISGTFLITPPKMGTPTKRREQDCRTNLFGVSKVKGTPHHSVLNVQFKYKFCARFCQSFDTDFTIFLFRELFRAVCRIRK